MHYIITVACTVFQYTNIAKEMVTFLFWNSKLNASYCVYYLIKIRILSDNIVAGWVFIPERICIPPPSVSVHIQPVFKWQFNPLNLKRFGQWIKKVTRGIHILADWQFGRTILDNAFSFNNVGAIIKYHGVYWSLDSHLVVTVRSHRGYKGSDENENRLSVSHNVVLTEWRNQ